LAEFVLRPLPHFGAIAWQLLAATTVGIGNILCRGLCCLSFIRKMLFLFNCIRSLQVTGERIDTSSFNTASHSLVYRSSANCPLSNILVRVALMEISIGLWGITRSHAGWVGPNSWGVRVLRCDNFCHGLDSRLQMSQQASPTTTGDAGALRFKMSTGVPLGTLSIVYSVELKVTAAFGFALNTLLLSSTEYSCWLSFASSPKPESSLT
jgi:hypothetical protein